MKKKTKNVMTTMGIIGAACIGASTYICMMNNKKKMQERLKKYMTMTYPDIEG